MDEYIKRDAAIREIEQINPVDYGAMWDYEAHHWAGECLRDCKEAIDSIPTADVAPIEALERLRDEMCAQDLITMEGLKRLNTLIWKYTTVHDGGADHEDD